MELTTNYPVLTVCVPGGIGEYLTERGAVLFAVGLDPFEPPEKSAKMLAERADAVREKTGAEKVNVLAFGLAGLAARAAVKYSGGIASVTTVCTPHRGLRTADRLAEARVKRLSPAYLAYDNWAHLTGGDSPQLREVTGRLGTDEMRVFNLMNPDSKDVFYQSAVCAADGDERLRGAGSILGMYDGENDGAVSVYSAMWGTYCRVYRGVSHLAVPPEVYADALRKLTEHGF